MTDKKLIIGVILGIAIVSAIFMLNISKPNPVEAEVGYNLINNDDSVVSAITSSYIKDGNLIIHISNPNNEKIQIIGLEGSKKYKIKNDKVIIYNYKGEQFKLKIGSHSDIYEFGTWIIEGDKVYVNNSWGRLEAYPHTIYCSGWVYFNVTPYQDFGELDFLWGFNTTEVKPTKAEFYKPHFVNWTTNHSMFFYNVSSISLANDESCDYGNEYNSYKRKITYQVCSQWNETTGECEGYNTTSAVVCFDSYEQNGTNYTAFWHTDHSRIENWINVGKYLNHKEYDYKGMNRWWFVTNFKVEPNKTYTARAYVKVPVTTEGTSGKYYFAVKRSAETLSEAITSGHFMVLDPWWNASWSRKRPIHINNTGGSALTDYQVMLNITYDSDMNSDFSDIRIVNETSGETVPYWIEDKVDGSWCKIWFNASYIPANSWCNDTYYLYYGNPSAGSASDGDAVFEFFDDLEKPILFQAKNAASPTIDTGGYLAENIVYDEVTGKYWWIFSDRATSPDSIRLAYADSINGPWTVETDPIIQPEGDFWADSPHLVKFGNKWYVYYTLYPSNDCANGEIHVQESDNVNGSYGSDTLLLSKGSSGSWEDYRVGEPYVFEYNGTYYLFYMGSRNTVENMGPEKIGYATASSPTGPFTKYGSNPVIDGTEFYLHDPNNYDWAADPFVFQYNGIFYIGVTTIHQHIILYKTTDFVTFEYCKDVSPLGSIGPSGAWDGYRFIRGAVMKFGDTYYLTYTGCDPVDHDYKMAVVSMLINDKPWDGREFLPNWKPIRRGWKVASENGEKILKKEGSEDGASSITPYYSRTGNIRIDAIIKHLDSYDLTELLIDVSDPDNMYGGVWGYSDSLRIFSRESGTNNDWVTTSYTVPENTWLEVSFARIGNTLKLFYEDTVLEWTDDSPLSASHVGIRVGSTKTGAVKKIRVRKYASPEPSAELGAEEQQDTDTSFTVTLPAGYTYAHFNLTGVEGASTKTNYPPEGQSDSQPFFNISNTGNVNLTVKMKINATIPNVILKADTDNNPSGAKEINTTYAVLCEDLPPNEYLNVWLWTDLSHAEEQETERELAIAVSSIYGEFPYTFPITLG